MKKLCEDCHKRVRWWQKKIIWKIRSCEGDSKMYYHLKCEMNSAMNIYKEAKNES